MRRRHFIALIAGAATFQSHAVLAADKPFRVGIASLVNPRSAPQFQAFEQRLRELESADGQDFTIDFDLLDGNPGSFPDAVQRLINRGADVLLAPGQEVALRAARAATRTIPIVMVAIDYDPIALGYAQSLSRPGGNITGVYFNTIETAAKRVELLKEAVPSTTRMIVFWDAISTDSFQATVAAAQGLGLKLQSVQLRNPPYDYEAALATATPGPKDALLCVQSPFFFHDREELDALAIRHRLPSLCGGVDSGGLVAYAPSLNAMFRTAADYVHKIRDGANPSELPIEQPTRYKLVVSLRMAKALGVTIPPSILARADEVVE
ncbi:MAG TPA: ABC transporter substrate-binding protein [Stellaceae bacterium]|nr:ABC transporter substrate-binding protein [Stellaceae bacterium]